MMAVTGFVMNLVLFIQFFPLFSGAHSGAVVEALRYKPEGRGLDSRWCRWIFFF
jgi:hypothetical protein